MTKWQCNERVQWPPSLNEWFTVLKYLSVFMLINTLLYTVGKTIIWSFICCLCIHVISHGNINRAIIIIIKYQLFKRAAFKLYRTLQKLYPISNVNKSYNIRHRDFVDVSKTLIKWSFTDNGQIVSRGIGAAPLPPSREAYRGAQHGALQHSMALQNSDPQVSFHGTFPVGSFNK